MLLRHDKRQKFHCLLVSFHLRCPRNFKDGVIRLNHRLYGGKNPKYKLMQFLTTIFLQRQEGSGF